MACRKRGRLGLYPVNNKRDLGTYIEDLELNHIYRSDLISSGKFLENYGGMAPYDEDENKRYTIDNEYICFFKKKGFALIGLPDEPDGISTDHEFFSIYEDFFIEFFPRTIMRIYLYSSINTVSKSSPTRQRRKMVQ